ncbi:MAG: YjbQ family protein [Acidobacteria bacterium]|nr:YjbQ family protein [Acidobacteriota bacterium]
MVQQIEVRTPSHSCLVDITGQVQRAVSQSGIREGVCCIFVPHTTAGVTINENADPTVRSDILRELEKIVPWRDHYEHSEGNAAAHIKSSLVGTSQIVFVSAGQVKLGTWQGIFFAEFDGPRTRKVWLRIVAC